MTGRHAMLLVLAMLAPMTIARVSAFEACQTSGDRPGPGELRQIRLCAADAPRCASDRAPGYKAARPPDRRVGAIRIADVPDGYVIAGGDLFSSAYDLATRGFVNVRFERHGDPRRYCGQHDWIDVAADWTGDEDTAHIDLDVCLRLEKWTGDAPAGPCPTSSP